MDPLYALPSPEIEQHCLKDIDLSLERIGRSDALRADFDLAAYRRSKLKALEEFLADRLVHPESYQTASLPNLPFDAGSFDLVVCGHLLFSYAPWPMGVFLKRIALTWHGTAPPCSNSCGSAGARCASTPPTRAADRPGCIRLWNHC